MKKYNSIEEMGEMLIDIWINIDVHDGDFVKRQLTDMRYQIHTTVLRNMNLTEWAWLQAQEKSSPDNYYERLESLYYSELSILTSQVFMFAATKQRHWPELPLTTPTLQV